MPIIVCLRCKVLKIKGYSPMKIYGKYGGLSFFYYVFITINKGKLYSTDSLFDFVFIK